MMGLIFPVRFSTEPPTPTEREQRSKSTTKNGVEFGWE